LRSLASRFPHLFKPGSILEQAQCARRHALHIAHRIQQPGYAVVDQELELGLRSIAVPVAGPSGAIVASINAGVPSVRVSLKDLVQRVLPELKLAAAELSRTLVRAERGPRLPVKRPSDSPAPRHPR